MAKRKFSRKKQKKNQPAPIWTQWILSLTLKSPQFCGVRRALLKIKMWHWYFSKFFKIKYQVIQLVTGHVNLWSLHNCFAQKGEWKLFCRLSLMSLMTSWGLWLPAWTHNQQPAIGCGSNYLRLRDFQLLQTRRSGFKRVNLFTASQKQKKNGSIFPFTFKRTCNELRQPSIVVFFCSVIF